jgi:predicted small secreted protein
MKAQHMNKHKIKITWATLSLLVAVLVLGGCNTWEGAGKDVERAGEKMQGDK